jgi:hypothetical protein
MKSQANNDGGQTKLREENSTVRHHASTTMTTTTAALSSSKMRPKEVSNTMSASKAKMPQKKAPKKGGKARGKKEKEALFDTESKDTAEGGTTLASEPKTPPKRSPHKKSPKKKTPKKARLKKGALFDPKSMDVVVPTALLAESTGGECSLLVQIDPQDATRLDFEGQTGAIGRFEAGDTAGELYFLSIQPIAVMNKVLTSVLPVKVTLDLKGYQYHGTIHPGPTALVVSVGKTGQLKVDSVTDEFVTLKQTQDVLAKLDAVVKGDMDEGYAVVEEDVNVKSKVVEETAPPTKKRKVSGKKKKS